MNKLYVGFSKAIELPKGGCLLISDDVPRVPRARIFDPKVDCFNPLKNIDYKKAREIADVLYTVAPQGENTLTVRNGKRALLKALLHVKRFDDIDGDEEVEGMIGVNTVQELAPRLRQNVLLIKEKVAAETAVEDAETLAGYARLASGTVAFSDFVTAAVA